MSNLIIKQQNKLKIAIKILASRTKSEALLTVMEELTKSTISHDTLEDLFNSQGASKAIEKPIISATMARLLTLRSFLIPDTLPELLCWLDGHQELQDTSLRFQQEFWRCLTGLINDSHLDSESSAALTRNLVQGISTLLPELKKGQIKPILFTTLLKNSQSIWNQYRKDFIISIEKDLSYIADNIDGLKKIKQDQTIEELSTDPKFWLPLTKIFNFENKQRYILSEYLPFAELFSQLARTSNEYKLAAYFYQVSQGKVSTPIFYESFGKQDFVQYLGLTIRRDIKLFERLNELFIYIIYCFSFAAFRIIMAIVFDNYRPPGFKVPETIPPSRLQKAVEKIDTSSISLVEFTNDILEQINLPENSQNAALVNFTFDEIKDAVLEIICSQDKIDKCKNEIDISSNLEQNKEAWATKLYEYQYNLNTATIGFIRPSISLDYRTKKEIIDNLKTKILTPRDISKALEEFSTTSKSVTTLIDKIAQESGKDNQTIILEFKRALGIPENEFDSYQYSEFAIFESEKIPNNPDLKTQLKWIEKIAEYQRNQKNLNDYKYGIIQKTDNTISLFKISIFNALTYD